MKGAVDPRPNSNPIVTAIVYISNVNFCPTTIHFRVYRKMKDTKHCDSTLHLPTHHGIKWCSDQSGTELHPSTDYPVKPERKKTCLLSLSWYSYWLPANSWRLLPQVTLEVEQYTNYRLSKMSQYVERSTTNYNYLQYLIVGLHRGFPRKRSLLQFEDLPSMQLYYNTLGKDVPILCLFSQS